MTLVHRVLFPHSITSLDEYVRRRGGRGLDAAITMTPEQILVAVEQAGLRGRGGAGFPTAVKWRTTIENTPPGAAPTIVVNGAEGEPGSFKDRAILRADPYVVVEGALIAARAVGSDAVVIALKAAFTGEIERVHGAIDEMDAAGWTDGVHLAVVEGPDEYLFGEETALLEVIDGRVPFPRIQPPFRRGVSEVWIDARRIDRRSGLAANLELGGEGGGPGVTPAVVENVETIANVAGIVGRGPAWFRTEGTDASPGTIVCTVSGSTLRAGLGEVPMGTPLRAVIEALGGGVLADRRIKAVLSGVSNPVLTADRLDTPLSYEAMQAAGSGLGTGGFLVYDDQVDMVAVAAGVARFLSVESCGQCTPCKRDGLSIAEHLARLCRNEADGATMIALEQRLSTVADGARCFLGTQEQVVTASLLAAFPEEFEAHVERRAEPCEPLLVSEMLDLAGYEAVPDRRFATKQPDWTYGDEWGGQIPAERLGEHRAPQALDH